MILHSQQSLILTSLFKMLATPLSAAKFTNATIVPCCCNALPINISRATFNLHIIIKILSIASMLCFAVPIAFFMYVSHDTTAVLRASAFLLGSVYHILHVAAFLINQRRFQVIYNIIISAINGYLKKCLK